MINLGKGISKIIARADSVTMHATCKSSTYYYKPKKITKLEWHGVNFCQFFLRLFYNTLTAVQGLLTPLFKRKVSLFSGT